MTDSEKAYKAHKTAEIKKETINKICCRLNTVTDSYGMLPFTEDKRELTYYRRKCIQAGYLIKAVMSFKT